MQTNCLIRNFPGWVGGLPELVLQREIYFYDKDKNSNKVFLVTKVGYKLSLVTNEVIRVTTYQFC